MGRYHSGAQLLDLPGQPCAGRSDHDGCGLDDPDRQEGTDPRIDGQCGHEA